MLYPSFLRTRTICQFDLCSLLFRNVTHLNRLCSPKFIAMHSPRRIRVVKTLSRIPANPSSIPNLPVIVLFSHSTRVFIINVFLLQGNNRAKKSPNLLGWVILLYIRLDYLIPFTENFFSTLPKECLRTTKSVDADLVSVFVKVIGNVGYPVSYVLVM